MLQSLHFHPIGVGRIHHRIVKDAANIHIGRMGGGLICSNNFQILKATSNRAGMVPDEPRVAERVRVALDSLHGEGLPDPLQEPEALSR